MLLKLNHWPAVLMMNEDDEDVEIIDPLPQHVQIEDEDELVVRSTLQTDLLQFCNG